MTGAGGERWRRRLGALRRRAWTWAAVLLSIGLSLAIAWLHVEQQEEFEGSVEALGSIRQARLDLAKGFVQVTLALSAHSPADRLQGVALLEQAVADLERALARAGAGGGAAGLQDEVSDLRTLLAAGASGGPPPPGWEAELRSTFHALERQAGRLDAASQAGLASLSRRSDRNFQVTLAAAVALLTVVCVGVYRAARQEGRAVRALQASEDQLRASNARYARQEQALSAMTRACAQGQAGPADLAREVARLAADTLEVARVSVWRHERDRARLACVAAHARAPALAAAEAPITAAACPAFLEAVLRGDLVAVADAGEDERVRDLRAERLERRGIGALLVAPLHLAGPIAGALLLEQAGAPRAWTADEETFAIAVANLLSLLLAEEERQAVEQQLWQSQKLEAVGQLAGGVAHDFNNLLAAILMQADESLQSPDLPAAAVEGLEDIRAAGVRAADLTRQLLAFSRRQVMQPRDLDLNQVVTDLSRMLQRLLGGSVRLHLALSPRPPVVRGDAGMIEQVLLNLAVNARDAMPGGGELRLEVAEVDVAEGASAGVPDAAPGRYGCLSVIDHGAGIPPEVLPRIFEPFFTTKEQGKGTGLGLSTVFGIVKQHRGWVAVQSEVGRGTTVRVYLPGVAGQGEPARPTEARTAPAGSESVLVVEDEPGLRRALRGALERGGYTVLEARDGREALATWAVHRGAIALLVADLVMPGGLGGRELGRRLRAERPGLKVVYVSGYAASVAGQEVVLEAGEAFLPKPFGADQLLQVVRRTLDG